MLEPRIVFQPALDPSSLHTCMHRFDSLTTRLADHAYLLAQNRSRARQTRSWAHQSMTQPTGTSLADPAAHNEDAGGEDTSRPTHTDDAGDENQAPATHNHDTADAETTPPTDTTFPRVLGLRWAAFACAVGYAVRPWKHMASLAEANSARICFGDMSTPELIPVAEPTSQKISDGSELIRLDEDGCFILSAEEPIELAFQVQRRQDNGVGDGTVRCGLRMGLTPAGHMSDWDKWDEWDGGTVAVYSGDSEDGMRILTFRRPDSKREETVKTFLRVSQDTQDGFELGLGGHRPHAAQDAGELAQSLGSLGWTARIHCDTLTRGKRHQDEDEEGREDAADDPSV